MTDRELLELAAKAIGWFDYPTDSIEQGSVWHTDREKAPFDYCFPKEHWNPLTDDGDALRLAVKMGMRDEWGCTLYLADAEDTTVVFTVSSSISPREDADVDPYAATRRAIVRAAAELGKELA